MCECSPWMTDARLDQGSTAMFRCKARCQVRATMFSKGKHVRTFLLFNALSLYRQPLERQNSNLDPQCWQTMDVCEVASCGTWEHQAAR